METLFLCCGFKVLSPAAAVLVGFFTGPESFHPRLGEGGCHQAHRAMGADHRAEIRRRCGQDGIDSLEAREGKLENTTKLEKLGLRNETVKVVLGKLRVWFGN